MEDEVSRELELMRACTETESLGVITSTDVHVRGAIMGGSWIVITTGLGGQMVQLAI